MTHNDRGTSEGDMVNPSRTKLTYDDLVLLPDDGLRHELIDGEHYVTPSPNTRHQRILGTLYWLLRSYLAEHPAGEAFLAPFDVVFTRYDVVEPDLLYVSASRHMQVITDKNVQGAPDLVVEIGSPSTQSRDQTLKRRLYESQEVSEYWMIDPYAERVQVLRRAGEGFDVPLELTRAAGDVLTTPLLPELGVPLEQLFADPLQRS